MQKPSRIQALLLLGLLMLFPPLLTSCAGGGAGRVPTYPYYSPGFSDYYHAPWGYQPIYIAPREAYPDWGVEPEPGAEPDLGVEPELGAEPDLGVEPDIPAAEPLPDLGVPDFGDIDFGGFD